MHGECSKNGIRPVAGIEFRNDNELQYIGIARNNNGLSELNSFLSDLNFTSSPIPFPAPHFSEAYIIYSLKKVPGRKLFDNERTGIKPDEMNSLLTIDFIRRQEHNGDTATRDIPGYQMTSSYTEA